MKKTLLLAALIGLSPAVFASGAYFGLNYSLLDAELAQNNGDASLGAVGMIGGYEVNDYISVEGRAGMGVAEDTVNGADVKLNSYFGGYLK